MEEQRFQPVPEVIDGNLVDETEINTEEADVNRKEVRKEDEDDEEFYERIEAPKFVDFTKPYTVRTDDRYWFCSRVGCDQKHEEEINPEEISKNFVLRVLAARSPNIKLRKALNREHSSIKCPLSAPAKPSKPRIPSLAMVSSLNTQKKADPQSKMGPCSKVGPTPLAKSRQVAAKYMTTPRNKMCQPNSYSFRSVQNPKKTTADMAKDRTVAKALVFQSPKKAIILKRSVELHTPLTKICEGMKRLEITSQKKTLKGIISKPKKPETEDSSRRKLKICKSEKKSKDLVPLKSTKTQNKKTPSNKCHSLHEKVVDVKLNDGCTSEISKKKENLQTQEASDTTNSHALRAEMKELPNIEDKENMGSEHIENALNPQDNDGKENSLNPQENNRSNNQQLGDKILSKEMHKKNKVVQTAGPAVIKCKKPKPTNIKPFRLRTDERGILKEAILERKLHFPEKEVAKDTSVIKRTFRVPKNEKISTENRKHNDSTSNKCRKESGAAGSEQKRTSLRTKSRSVRMPGQQLGVIEEKSCKLTSDVKVVENKTRAVSAARVKRPVTIAKEPNFHTSHLPRTCSMKIA